LRVRSAEYLTNGNCTKYHQEWQWECDIAASSELCIFIEDESENTEEMEWMMIVIERERMDKGLAQCSLEAITVHFTDVRITFYISSRSSWKIRVCHSRCSVAIHTRKYLTTTGAACQCTEYCTDTGTFIMLRNYEMGKEIHCFVVFRIAKYERICLIIERNLSILEFLSYQTKIDIPFGTKRIVWP
jgi:hypothetical protein